MKRIFLIILCSVCIGLNAQLDTLQLSPNQDTYIKAEFQAPNSYTAQSVQNGNQDSLMICKTQSNPSPLKYFVYRSLIQFDLDDLPFGAIVTNAELTLYKTQNDNSLRYIKARMITAEWTESDASWAAMFNKTNSYTATDYTTNTGNSMTFNLTDIVKYWQCASPNFGVMISPTADNQSSAPYNMPFNFYSSEVSSESLRPKLTIQYYLPINAVASIQPASNGTNTDGSIELFIGGGTGQNYSFQWFDSNFNQIATTSTLSNKQAGIYALKITDTAGGVFRKIYVIPSETTSITVSIRPNGEFGIDAHYTPTNTFTTGFIRIGTVPNLGLANGTTSPGNKAEAGLIFDIDYSNLKDFNITTATATFKEWSTVHNAYSISAYKITEPWSEDCLCHAKRPTIDNTPFANLPTITANYPANLWSIDLKNNINSIIENETADYGMLLVPDSVMATVVVGQGNAYTANNAEVTMSSNRPVLNLIIEPSFHIKPETTSITKTNFGSIKLNPKNGNSPFKIYWGESYMTNQEYSELISEQNAEDQPSFLPYESIFESGIDSLVLERGFEVKYSVKDSNDSIYHGSAYLNEELFVNNGTNYSFNANRISNNSTNNNEAEVKLDNGTIGFDLVEASFFIQRMGGFVIYGISEFGTTDLPEYGHIKFGYKFLGSKIFPIETGIVQSAIYQHFDDSKLCTVVLKGNEMQLFIDEKFIHSIFIGQNVVWRENIVLQKQNSKIVFERHNWPWLGKKAELKLLVEDVNCDGTGFGRIEAKQLVFVENGTAILNPINQTYTLTGNQFTEENQTGVFENLMPGNYSLTVSISNNINYQYNIDVGYKVEWETILSAWGLEDCDAKDALVRLTTGPLQTNRSKNKLWPGLTGWIEFDIDCSELNEPYMNRHFGFRSNETPTSVATNGVAQMQTAFTGNYFDTYNFCTDNSNLETFSSSITTTHLAFGIKKLRINRDVSNNGFTYSFLNQNLQHCQIYNSSIDDQSPITAVLNSNSDALVSTLEAYSRMRKIGNQLSPMILNARASFGCINNSSYSELKRILDGSCHLVQINEQEVESNKLRFRYFEQYNDSDGVLDCKVYDQVREVVLAPNLDIKYGTNYLEMDVSALNNGVYVLEVTDSKGEIYKLRFMIIA